MEGGDLVPLLEQLESNVDDLQKVLQPLLQGSLCISLISDMSRKLPLLDRAKLLMLITYTLESLLFSYLRLHGVDSREHLVYKELTCIKQYFEKIKVLETSPEKRAMALDKKAADPFIKHGLPRSDLERAEKEAKEKALAQLRAMKLAKKSAVSQQASAKECSSHSTNSGSRPASQSDSHSNKHGSAEGSVPVAKAPATTAQQPSVKKTAKEKSRGRRERYKAAKAVKNPQTQLGKKGDGSKLRKAKSSGKRRRLAAKAAAKDKNVKAS
ncbi:hypothetical protein Egran_06071 [Elaphomyces granulatus]|uniref:Exosome complex protein n=1 Tax=Elaphomyces granulatus TaxID=519963 RepID=A0A232LQ14_9EURO|nr:hypothetical protein Egran_06071 [Elaphomyces granulatus]